MDWVCESLIDHLSKEGRDRGMSLRRLMDASGYARQTVYNHLKHLTISGLVSKKVMKHGRGRPEVLYRVNRQAFRVPSEAVVVSLAFERLRRVCRFEKGGWLRRLEVNVPQVTVLCLSPQNRIYFSLSFDEKTQNFSN